MKRLLLVLALCVSAVSFAQESVKKGMVHEVEYDSFTAVNVSDDFIVTLGVSDRFYSRIVSDERLEKYVKAYVRNGTLYVTLDRKNIPSELKKSLRAKGNPVPVLEAEISFPAIKSLELSENVIMHKSDVIYSDAFTLTLNDKARVDKIHIDCKTAELKLSKSSYADVVVVADAELFVSTSNTAKAVVKLEGKGLKIDASGSSMVDAVVNVKDVEISAAGTSATKLVSGTANEVEVKASGSSKVDMESVAIAKGYVVLEGMSKCYSDITDDLKVNLTGNSQLTFKSKPEINVERIVGSTLIKADDPKRK